MQWEWPKLKQELTNLSSSLKLQMHLEASDHAPCQQTTIDLMIEEHEKLQGTLRVQGLALRMSQATNEEIHAEYQNMWRERNALRREVERLKEAMAKIPAQASFEDCCRLSVQTLEFKE